MKLAAPVVALAAVLTAASIAGQVQTPPPGQPPAGAGDPAGQPAPGGGRAGGQGGRGNAAAALFNEICAACHGMNLMHYRNLGDRHGPFWNPKYPNPNDNPVVKALAAENQAPDIDSETGEAIQRDATPADKFRSPYPNATAAAAVPISFSGARATTV